MGNFELDRSIGYVVNRAAMRMKAELQRAFRENGYKVTTEHWAVMNCLWEKEGSTQTEIAEKIAKDKTNLTRILDVMERDGLVRREYHESDRRSYRIFLTQEGWKMKDGLIAIAEAINGRAIRGMGSGGEREIIRLMNIINKNLEKKS